MKNLIFNNTGLKLLSLGFAILLWFIISARGTSEITLDVPIEYINIPKGLEILRKDRDRVNVSIFGSERILRAVKPDDLRVFIDLKGSPSGTRVYSIIRRNIKVPAAVTVSNVSPSSVKITLDRTIEREVPVKVVLDRIPRDYKLIIKPDRVRIEGPESIVRNVHILKTEPLKLRDLKNGNKRDATIITNLDKVRLSVDMVEVSLEKKEKQGGGK
ncbi:YbbR-like protein [bacterium BMS3Bbin06]|nr:YbbR-like protein [bacterium BMS3Abin08]GBE34425.1 YbbR-like protein [bacterium BMS3Bbin06]HDO36306.1 hypothetical protein [Nitrospirota bacterium]HDY70310.1 hypothetical protein [Nitrospirota bacterium]